MLDSAPSQARTPRAERASRSRGVDRSAETRPADTAPPKRTASRPAKPAEAEAKPQAKAETKTETKPEQPSIQADTTVTAEATPDTSALAAFSAEVEKTESETAAPDFAEGDVIIAPEQTADTVVADVPEPPKAEAAPVPTAPVVAVAIPAPAPAPVNTAPVAPAGPAVAAAAEIQIAAAVPAKTAAAAPAETTDAPVQVDAAPKPQTNTTAAAHAPVESTPDTTVDAEAAPKTPVLKADAEQPAPEIDVAAPTERKADTALVKPDFTPIKPEHHASAARPSDAPKPLEHAEPADAPVDAKAPAAHQAKTSEHAASPARAAAPEPRAEAPATTAAPAQTTTNNAPPAPFLVAAHAPLPTVSPLTALRVDKPADNAIPVAGVAVEIVTRAMDGNRRFEIRLDPPELGRIDVRLDVDTGGKVTSRLVVERADTLDLLRRDAPQLERALQNAGLNTEGGLQFSLRDQHSAQREQGREPVVANLIVPDDETVAAEAARRGYGRMIGLGGGVDIKV